MDNDIQVALIETILPLIILLLGGQYFLDKYAINKKTKEAEIELIKKTREEKYAIIHQLYDLFGAFMKLYRKIDSPFHDITDLKIRTNLFNEIIESESKVDAIILKIGCEFVEATDNREKIEEMLGNLRQSIHFWRERVKNGERIAFEGSNDENYLRFKASFSSVSAFMINKIYGHLEKPEVKMKRVEGILIGAFDNKHEKWNVPDFIHKKEFKKYYKPVLNQTT